MGLYMLKKKNIYGIVNRIYINDIVLSIIHWNNAYLENSEQENMFALL